MEHNEKDFYEEIESPFKDFVFKYKISTEATPITKALLKFPAELYSIPHKYPEASGPAFLTKLMYKFAHFTQALSLSSGGSHMHSA